MNKFVEAIVGITTWVGIALWIMAAVIAPLGIIFWAFEKLLIVL